MLLVPKFGLSLFLWHAPPSGRNLCLRTKPTPTCTPDNLGFVVLMFMRVMANVTTDTGVNFYLAPVVIYVARHI